MEQNNKRNQFSVAAGKGYRRDEKPKNEKRKIWIDGILLSFNII